VTPIATVALNAIRCDCRSMPPVPRWITAEAATSRSARAIATGSALHAAGTTADT
jgi:hypothetical protein